MKFEEYLRDEHAKVYSGVDDDMEDSYLDWECGIMEDGRIYILGDLFGNEKILEMLNKMNEEAREDGM